MTVIAHNQIDRFSYAGVDTFHVGSGSRMTKVLVITSLNVSNYMCIT